MDTTVVEIAQALHLFQLYPGVQRSLHCLRITPSSGVDALETGSNED